MMIKNPVAQQHLPISENWGDGIVDNLDSQYLPSLCRDILNSAINACNTESLDDLIFTITNWQATVEELSRPPEELEEIRQARAEVRACASLCSTLQQED